jgi:hypothetical protein
VAAERTVPRAQQVPPAPLPWMGRTLRGPPTA